MAHTPGPWYAEGSDIGSAENVTVGVAIAGRNDDGYISHAEVQANAYLMAAAPEMLSALKEIAECCERRLRKGKDQGDLDTLRVCRTAIAKAEGRE
jgi:hypothetical protein